jgi:hypothetical protein
VQGVPGVGEVVAAFGDAGELGECLGRVGFEELDEGIEEGGAFGVVFVGGVAGAGVEVVGAEDAHDADGGQGGHVDDALLVARLGFVVAGGDFDFGLDLELHVGREDGAGAGVAFLEGVAAGGAFAGLGGGAVGFLAVFAGGGLLCGGGVAGHGWGSSMKVGSARELNVRTGGSWHCYEDVTVAPGKVSVRMKDGSLEWSEPRGQTAGLAAPAGVSEKLTSDIIESDALPYR